MNIKNGNYFAKDCVDGNDWSIYNFIIRESNNNIPVYYQYGYIYNTKDYENEKIFVKDIEKEDLNNLFISIGNNAKTMAQALLSKKLEVSKLVKEEFLITIATIGEVMKGCVVNSDWPLENFEIRIFIEKRKKIRRLKSVCFCYGDNNFSSDAINSLSKNINELINNSVFNVYLDTYDFIKSDFNMKITDKNMSEIDNVFVKEMLNELEFAMYKKCKLECNLNDTKQVVKQNIKIHKI